MFEPETVTVNEDRNGDTYQTNYNSNYDFNYNKAQAISKPVNHLNLYVHVSNFETKAVGREEMIFFKVELYSGITKQNWTVYHRYNDFYEFNIILAKYYLNAPKQVIRTYIKIANVSELIKRKEDLNSFLLDVVDRSDLLTSPYAIKFLKLENHYPDINLYQPFQLYSLSDELAFPITAGYFLTQGSLLFLGLGKAPTGITTLLSKLSFLQSPSTQPLGQLVIYNIIKSYQGACHFEPIFVKELYSECTSIDFLSEKNCLCVGMNNGHIALYKIYINESSKETKEFAEYVGTMKCHRKPIVGACVNFQLGYIYTFAQETVVKISELNYQTLMKEVPLTRRNITQMEYDARWGRVILCDEGSSIYFVDLMAKPLQPTILQTFHGLINDVSCIYINFDNNLLVLGTSNGVVSMFKLCNYNEKMFTDSYNSNASQIELIKIKDINLFSQLRVTKIAITNKEELLFGLSNGSVAVYVHETQNPEYVIDAHLECVSSLFWENEKKFLITISEDKTAKMYQLPIYWPGEMIRKSQETNRKKVLDRTSDNSLFIKASSDMEGSCAIDEEEEQKKAVIRERQIWSEDLDGWSTEM